MAFTLFGFEIQRRRPEEDEREKRPSFVPPTNDDGSMVVAEGNFYGTLYDLNGTATSETELISKYREVALYPDVEYAIDDIVNEAITIDGGNDVVKFNMDSFEEGSVFADEGIKDKVQKEFKKVIEALDFNNNAYDIFKRWYIDGRIYYHVIVDDAAPGTGIKELRYVDPRKIRKVKEVKRVNYASQTSVAQLTQLKSEYYVFSSTGFGKTVPGMSTGVDQTAYGLKIAKDSVIYAHSGLLDPTGNMVLSYLHSVIRVLNALKSLEDSLVIYRFTRAPERRIFYIDVGNLPRQKAEQYIKDMMVKHKNKLVYDSSSGAIRDDRRFMCYALDTRIPLLDGRTLTLQQITDEYESGKKNWVYSCDPVSGKFVPGPVSWSGVTKRDAEVVKVTFDNGKSVVCTPDHKFPVWGKGFVEAKDLVGESVIPGYRRMMGIAHDGSGQDYEQIYQNDTKTWEFTHRAVARWKDEHGLREEMLHDSVYVDHDKQTVHHKNFDRLDNSPYNLVRMNRDDHLSYHRYCARNERRKKNTSNSFTPEWKANLSIAAKKRGVHRVHIKSWKIRTPEGEELIIENLSEFCRQNNLNRCNIKGKFGSRKYFAEQLRNHKAVRVEYLTELMDVGCLTVDLDETYHSHHTYLLDAGVYTKNTMFEDYWLPRREGSKGTQIETLPGGQNLGELSDVEYFQQKLYRALGVPISRMNPETSGFTFSKAAEISRDEVKFSRFIDRLRRRFSSLLFDALKIQLLLKNVISKDDVDELYRGGWFEFASDNHFAEVKDNEIMSRRIEVAKDIQDFVGKYFSHDFVRRKILRQDDDEIENMDQQIFDEKGDPRFPDRPFGMGTGIGVSDPTFGADSIGGNPNPMPGQPQPAPQWGQQQPDPNQSQGPVPINSEKE